MAVVPASISPNGGLDVTRELNEFFADTPDGEPVQFRENAQYRCEGELRLVDRSFEIDGRGAMIFANEAWPGGFPGTASFVEGVNNRRQIDLTGGGPYRIANLRVRGANKNGGTGDYAYIEGLEQQHCIAAHGVIGLEIDNCELTDCHGDFVSLGVDDRVPNKRDYSSQAELVEARAAKKARAQAMSDWTENVWVHGCTMQRNGRQGVALRGVRGALFEGNYIGQVRRATWDFEPNARYDGVQNVTVRRNTFGPGRLNFIASAGGSAPIEDILFEENLLDGKNMTVLVKPPLLGVRRRWRLINNRSTGRYGGPPMIRLYRLHDSEISGNYNPVSRLPAVYVDPSCSGIDIEDGQFPLLERVS